jgi:hypothetical protein
LHEHSTVNLWEVAKFTIKMTINTDLFTLINNQLIDMEKYFIINDNNKEKIKSVNDELAGKFPRIISQINRQRNGWAISVSGPDNEVVEYIDKLKSAINIYALWIKIISAIWFFIFNFFECSISKEYRNRRE